MKIKLIYIIVSIALGGALGFLYWKYVGCASGSCAITSVWWRSTLYGMVLGVLMRDVIGNGMYKITGW
ncbi:MAG TPA: hypothetical protein EYN28_06780 [Flavobacteriales bacterium]|nr:hypothetical protein [Flavobacteriales bacterium]HHZ97266.1 hypothetical protein [Flavobacteriales bacterium]HIB76617.1 hypothetical protein [Flavobacteriales bacterium]HIN41709.1 hypothetical protein [Flavobacteriales bacterium]HIO16683.1 hypothetical protein [Flavobacteriales bacterium]